jgi:large subunit ribosomal protein L24
MNLVAKAIYLQRQQRKLPKVFPKDIAASWKIVKGDKVQVISGDDKGHIGTIIKVLREKNQVLVSGANLARKHFKTNSPDQGLILNVEQGIHMSKVALLDPVDKKPVRVEMRLIREASTNEGDKATERMARVSVRSHYEIPIPIPTPKVRLEGQLDTKPDLVTRITYTPDIRVPPTPLDCILSPHHHF